MSTSEERGSGFSRIRVSKRKILFGIDTCDRPRGRRSNGLWLASWRTAVRAGRHLVTTDEVVPPWPQSGVRRGRNV